MIMSNELGEMVDLATVAILYGWVDVWTTVTGSLPPC